MLSMIQNKIHLRLRVVSTECWKKQDPYLNFDWNWNNQVKKRFFYPMCSNEYFQILPQNAPFCVKFLQNFPGEVPRTPLALFPPDCQFSILNSLVHNFYLNLCDPVRWDGGTLSQCGGIMTQWGVKKGEWLSQMVRRDNDLVEWCGGRKTLWGGDEGICISEEVLRVCLTQWGGIVTMWDGEEGIWPSEEVIWPGERMCRDSDPVWRFYDTVRWSVGILTQ